MLSLIGFALRGYWMIKESPLLKSKPVKVLPHIVDTFLLLSAFGLLFILGFDMAKQAWIAHKITLLVVYIILGVVALGDKYSKSIRVSAFFAGLIVFAYILGIAVNKTPLSWFSFLS